MEETKKSSKFFARGWFMIFITFLTAICTQGFGIYSFSMFKVPMTEMLGCDATQVAFGFSIYALVVGFANLVIGDVMAKVKLRGCMIISAFLYGGGFIILGLLDQLWMVYLAYVVMGIGSAFGGIIVVSGMPSNWFVKYRGIATGIVWCAMLPGSYITTSLVSTFAAGGNWQTAALVLGAIAFVVLFASAFILKWQPQELGLLPDGMTKEEAAQVAEKAGAAKLVGLDRKKAVKTSAFWLLLIGFAVCGIGEQGPFQNFPTFIVSQGFDLATAGAFMSFLAFAGCIGKLTAGLIIDKLGPRWAYSILSVLAAIGLVSIALFGTSLTALYVGGFFFGAALSSSTVCFSAGTAMYLGPKHYAQLYGLVFLGKPICDAIGVPLVAGISGTIGWSTTFMICAALILFSAFCMFVNKKNPELQKMEEQAARELSAE